MGCFSVCAVTKGQHHLQKGTPCDDAVFTAAANNCLVVAVSDGAGSRKYAAQGAVTASKNAARFVSAEFDGLYAMPEGEAGTTVLYIVRRLLAEEAEKLGCSVRELGATLMVCGIHNDGRSMTIHIGDGSVERLGEDGSISVISDYAHEEAENITELITSSAPQIKEYRSRSRSIYMLRTDGTEPMLSVPYVCSQFFNLAVLLSETRFREACAEIFTVPDDSTVAVVGDLSAAIDTVIAATDTAVLSNLLRLSPKAVKQRRICYGRVLTAAAGHPCTMHEMIRLSHQHSKYRLMQKLQPLLECGLLQYRNGFFRMEK